MTLIRSLASPPQQARAADAAENVDLMERISGGEVEALGKLYDRFSSMLLALGCRIIGNLADAEDVLQECFVEIWHKADRYDPSRASVSTWLILIARSRAIDHVRHRTSQERTAETAYRLDPRDRVAPQGADGVLDSERRQRVRMILERLPAKQREVLELAFYDGLSHTEIAYRTGIPLGTVKTRLLLAMKKLRRALRSEIEDLL